VAEVFGWSKPQAQVALAKARQLLDSFLQARLTTPTVLPTPEEKDSL
jgi:hypothetical protein